MNPWRFQNFRVSLRTFDIIFNTRQRCFTGIPWYVQVPIVRKHVLHLIPYTHVLFQPTQTRTQMQQEQEEVHSKPGLPVGCPTTNVHVHCITSHDLHTCKQKQDNEEKQRRGSCPFAPRRAQSPPFGFMPTSVDSIGATTAVVVVVFSKLGGTHHWRIGCKSNKIPVFHSAADIFNFGRHSYLWGDLNCSRCGLVSGTLFDRVCISCEPGHGLCEYHEPCNVTVQIQERRC
jgi:hypothetical protein